MIKASGRTGDGQPLLIVGLSGENMARLMAGEPIRFDADELGLPAMTVVVVGGRTEQDIADDLRKHGLLRDEVERR